MKPWAWTESPREREREKRRPRTQHWREMSRNQPQSTPRGSRDTRKECGPRGCSGHFVECRGNDHCVGDVDITSGLDYEQF